MNKKLIALALAALPVAAMADVTIYGSIRAGIESNRTYADQATTGSNTFGSKTEVNDWTSRIGFKGNEDLGNGLKTIWQVESRLNMDGTGSNTLGTRDSFIGLSGNFGTVRLGRLSDYANSDMEQVDPGYYAWDHSVGGLANFTRLDGRHNNAIRYDSPNFAGFSFEALWAADEKRDTVNGERTNGQFTNVGLSYENSGFFGKYNYGHWGDADKLASTSNWHRLEAGYNANNIYVALGYQQIQSYSAGDFYNPFIGSVVQNAITAANLTTPKLKMREAAITGGYTFGALTPYLSFAKGWNVNAEGAGDLSNSGYKQWVLGANYDLSKRTSAYASYGQVKWDDSSLEKERSFGVGLIHNF